jgi:hypothetical protein
MAITVFAMWVAVAFSFAMHPGVNAVGRSEPLARSAKLPKTFIDVSPNGEVRATHEDQMQAIGEDVEMDVSPRGQASPYVRRQASMVAVEIEKDLVQELSLGMVLDAAVPNVPLPDNVTQEQEEEAFDAEPDDALEMEMINSTDPVCGNGIVEDGEDCDTDACCTEQCKFEPKTVKCHESEDVCDAGGYCTGDSTVCKIGVVRAGVQCPNDGLCLDGTCASRVAQCTAVGLGAPCDESCEVLSCYDSSGKCVGAEDATPVLPGTPCGDGLQCSATGSCSTPESSLSVVSEQLMEKTPSLAEGNSSTKEAATSGTLLGLKICYVITRDVYEKGFKKPQVYELSNFLDLLYRSRTGMPLQPLIEQIYVDWARELDNYAYSDLGKFNSWVNNKLRSGGLRSGCSHVHLLGGKNCWGPSGMGYVGDVCGHYRTAITVVKDSLEAPVQD